MERLAVGGLLVNGSKSRLQQIHHLVNFRVVDARFTIWSTSEAYLDGQDIHLALALDVLRGRLGRLLLLPPGEPRAALRSQTSILELTLSKVNFGRCVKFWR